MKDYFNTNTVNANNFDLTMQEYLEYPIAFAKVCDIGFNDLHIKTLGNGFDGAKNDSSMEDERKLALKV